MKVVLILLALFATIYCQGQHISESEDNPEIEEIILNYHENKINNFEIRKNSIYGGKMDNKIEKHYYLILDDSILVEKYKKRGIKGDRYAIRNNQFYYLPDKPPVEKKVIHYNSEGPFPYSIRYDSANVNHVKFYTRNLDDSTLMYESKITKDSLGRVIEDILRNYSGPAKKNSTNSYKRIWQSDHYYQYRYNDDTVFIETRELKGKVWVPKYWTSYVAKASKTEADNSTEAITTINMKYGYYDSSLLSDYTYRTVRKIIYDDKRLIQSIIYGTQDLDNDNNWNYNAAKIFTVKQTKK